MNTLQNPIIFDTNFFIAIVHKFSKEDSLKCIEKVVLYSKQINFTPILSNSIILEMKTSLMIQRKLKELFEVVDIDKEKIHDFIENSTSVLTKGQNIADYEIILLADKLNAKIVTNDFLLKKEAKKLNSKIEVLNPFVFVELLYSKVKDSELKLLSDRLLLYFSENREPEEFVRYWDEFRRVVSAQTQTLLKKHNDPNVSDKIIRYLKGEYLTKGEKKRIKPLIPILALWRSKKFTSWLAIAERVRNLALSYTYEDPKLIENLKPIFQEISLKLLERGVIKWEKYDLYAALERLNTSDNFFLQIIDKSNIEQITKTHILRTILYMIKNDFREAITILGSIEKLVIDTPTKQDDKMWLQAQLVAYYLTNNEEERKRIEEKCVNSKIDIHESYYLYAKLFYFYGNYLSAKKLFEKNIADGVINQKNVILLYNCVWGLNESISSEILEKIPEELKRNDKTDEKLQCETPACEISAFTPASNAQKWIIEPMKVYRRIIIHDDVLFVCRNEKIESNIGILVLKSKLNGNNIDQITIYDGNVKLKEPIYKDIYGIRGIIETDETTKINFKEKKIKLFD